MGRSRIVVFRDVSLRNLSCNGLGDFALKTVVPTDNNFDRTLNREASIFIADRSINLIKVCYLEFKVIF